MRIEIANDNQNWLNWGKLIQLWIDDPASRPDTVQKLNTQLSEHRVVAKVEGKDDRRVTIQEYAGPEDPLRIMLPTRAMCDEMLLKVVPGLYPLPLFYDIAFGGAARANLSASEANDFAVRRVGEYSINECC